MAIIVITTNLESRIVNIRSDDDLQRDDFTLASAYLLLLAARLNVRAIGGQTSQAINIVNVLDPSVFEDYLTSGEGEKAIVNVMRRHQSMIEE